MKYRLIFKRLGVGREYRLVRWLVPLLLFSVFVNHMVADQSPPPRRDINAVLADHDDALLAIKGVTGVYVGLLDDKSTPCLRVMVIEDNPAIRRAVPPSLEGYPVVIEVSGHIRPLASTPLPGETK